MKKILTLFLGMLVTQLQAQYLQAYQPTISDLSGNGPTPDGKGYVYNFKGGRKEHCFKPLSGTNDFYNQFRSKNYSFALDTVNTYFQLLCNGLQEDTEVLCNHFSAGNCKFIEHYTPAYINLSDSTHRVIEIRLKSSVPVEKFGVMALFADAKGVLHLADGSGHETKELPAQEWQLMRFDLAASTWNGIALDPARMTGLAFYVRNEQAPHPKGQIDIDYIRLGSALEKDDPYGAANADASAYTFSFKANASRTCLRQANVTANPLFRFEVDHSTHQAVLTQEINSRTYTLFAIEFTDQDCFLQTINLTNEKDRVVEVKIKPDVDVHSFGVSVSGSHIQRGTWDYSHPVNPVALKGGVWNTVKVPLSMEAQGGLQIDPSHIRGIVFSVNPHSTQVKKDPSRKTIEYRIEYIKVGAK